jgi:nitroreductase
MRLLPSALAQLAPSNSNIQPWRIVFAAGPARARLVEALLEAARRGPPNIPPAGVVPVLPPRTRRGSLRVDGNRSRG